MSAKINPSDSPAPLPVQKALQIQSCEGRANFIDDTGAKIRGVWGCLGVDTFKVNIH